MKNKSRVLFICKQRNDSYGPSFGLLNSCKFICNALEKHKISAEVVSVVDNNAIDAEVHKFKPTHVFIEALWVVPAKFQVLCKMYPKVNWFVRIHSKIPFIANEGIAIEWLRAYEVLNLKNLHLSANNVDIIDSFKHAYGIKVKYHPNIYCPPDYPKFSSDKNPIPVERQSIIDIGCFGAIRPMKNQLIQAMAAISFGNDIRKKVRFHINGNRIEQKGDSTFKNLENAFKNTKHELVKHPWMEHKDFIRVVRSMDLGMQVSMSETFNIVAADFVWNNIPVVGSDEISWLSFLYRANPNDLHSIMKKLDTAYDGASLNLHRLNKWNLIRYNAEATKVWLDGI